MRWAFPASGGLKNPWHAACVQWPKAQRSVGGGQMTTFKDPFDPKTLLGKRCGCGGAHAEADHGRLTATAVPAGEEARWNRVVDAAVLRAVFPVDAQRRLFLKTVGAATAMTAISSVLPLGAARDAFAQGGPP